MMINRFSLLLIWGTLLSPVALAKLSQTYQDKDWYLTCDNTGTCYAAGYVALDQVDAAALLFVRSAGAHTPVTAKFFFDRYSDTSTGFIRLRVQGKDYGRIEWNMQLTSTQVAGVLQGIEHHSDIIFTHAHKQWVISNQGAMTVLKKMDEIQRRVHTPDAIMVKGNQPLTHILKPLKKPTIVKAPVIDKKIRWIKPQDSDYQPIMTAIKPLMKQYCDAPKEWDQQLGYAALDKTTAIVMHTCWMGAYNYADLTVMIHRKPPYAPTVVNNEAGNYINGMLEMSSKGRGLGDCWHMKQWVFDGKKFRLSADYDTGLCRGLTGGIAPMPTYVARVVEPKS
jgi:hypothetical protein